MKRRKITTLTMGLILSLGMFAGSCACDDPPTRAQLPRMIAELSPDSSGAATYLIDFGDVPVGSLRNNRFTIFNEGSAELVVKPSSLQAPFSTDVSVDGLLLPVGARTRMSFSFAPTVATEEASEAIVELATNEGESRAVRTVRLVGRGVPPGLDCVPDPVAFGTMIRGTEKRLTTVCTNPLNTTLELASASFTGSFSTYYSVMFREDFEDKLVLAPGDSVTLDIRFRAESLGFNDVVLILRDINKQLLAHIDVTAQTVAGALVLDPEECIDFGYVALGDSERRTLSVLNVGSEEIQLLDFRMPAGLEDQFSVHTAPPVSIIPAASEGVEIEFHPTRAGKHVTQLEIVTSDLRTGSSSVTACVSGFGGGPKIECSPERIDFGTVALGIPLTKRYICRNAGEAPEGVEIDPLVVESLVSDSEVFSASFVGADGTPGTPSPNGYAIGEEFYVDVTFAPTEEGFATGNILIQTNAGAGEPYAMPLFGEGRDLPSCDFSIIPPSLRFGTVDRGGEMKRKFTIENHLPTACLISNLRLSDDSDPFYSMDEIGSAVLEGYESLDVEVTFAPTDYKPQATGTVTFHISNEERPEQSVPLTGIAAFPCLQIEPNPVDFGKTGLGCFTRDQPVFFSNVCAFPVTVTDIGVDHTQYADDFFIQILPTLPLVLEPNRRDEFVMRFSPRALGTMEGLAYVEYVTASGDVGTRFAGLIGSGDDDLEQTDHFTQLERPKVDVLWVVDNSGSMGQFQDVIRDRLPIFTSFADEQDIDYQLAVTTTGIAPAAGLASTCGESRGGENGRFFPIDGGSWLPPHPRILTRDTPNLQAAWRRNVRVGECHGVEQPFHAALTALSPPLINEVKDSRPGLTGHPSWNDGNAGFLRPDAALSIVVLTDEVEQSFEFGMTPLGYVGALRDVKGPRFRHLLKISAITVPVRADPRPTCGQFRARGDRLMVGVEETDGVWFNICTPVEDAEAWDAGLRRISEGAFGFTTRFNLRGQPAGPVDGGPVTEADIIVKVNGQRVLDRDHAGTVWFYDPIANAVDFTPKNGPKPGAEISITYQVACLK